MTAIERAEDLTAFHTWLKAQHKVAIDTETSDLQIYSADHKLRLVIFGTPREAWVIPARLFEPSMIEGYQVVMMNAPFDWQVLVRHYPKYFNLEHRMSSVIDIKVRAHLVDPRGKEEGGTGHSLADLSRHYLGVDKLGSQLKDEFQRLKLRPLSEGYALIPEDNEVYLRYAGWDAILTARLETVLEPLSRPYSKLLKFEQKVAMVATSMDAQGFLLDTEYTETLSDRLKIEELMWKVRAEEMGVENINSTQQVSAWYEQHKILTPRTPKGNPSVDDSFLREMIDRPSVGPNPPPLASMAQAIIEGKKAGKWRKTWVEKFLTMADSGGRVHPSTNTLRARTARFSVTGIPTQTLPASDSLVRSCFVADTGERIVAVDYANQELRFLAAKSGDSRMIRAFKKNDDLHLITAEAAFPGRGLEMRKYGKLTNFATVYGVGANGLATQTGLPVDDCRILLRAFRSSYPGVAAFGERLGQDARRNGYIVTATGRHLPVDEDRSYSALNYYIQSGCRDVTAQALVDLYDAGFLKYMRLAIHDEVLFSLPEEGIEDSLKTIERIMSTRVGAVELPAEGVIAGKSWGDKYAVPTPKD